ncbi:MAG: DUF4331 family protein [Deltaproteobacteria bacterium]|nr:DUF4331 family protein [Deltaproteobacteria bacterium]
MKKIILIGVLFASTACGDDDAPDGNECGAGTTEVDDECVADAVCGAGTTLTDGMCLPDPGPGVVFRQVEHLARPGINEALLITDGFLEGYNATAPSFTGVPTDVLNAVVAEAKTVLKAIYLGSCLVSGTLGLTEGAGGTALKPGLVPCADVGNDIFSDGDALTGTVLETTSAAQAQVYADRMFAQFVPDVMRINTATNNYLTPCGTPTDALPLLCGGRRVDDDVIDVTYNYLIGGLAGTPGPQNDNNPANLGDQVRALTSDGVAFDTAANAGAGNNKNGLTDGVASNTQQDHPATTTTFPYSAAPF